MNIPDHYSDRAHSLFSRYELAADLDPALAARERQDVIALAAEDPKVWRLFCCLRDGFVSALGA